MKFSMIGQEKVTFKYRWLLGKAWPVHCLISVFMISDEEWYYQLLNIYGR